VLKRKKPKRGSETEINMALLGTAKAQFKKLLYFLRIFSFLYPSEWISTFLK
jgi:hypothetical protein